MPLNLKAVKDKDDELQARSSGSGEFLNLAKIDEPIIVRILPPTPEMNELYYFEEKGFWINGNRYVSPSSFGEECPMEEEYKIAKKEKDPDIEELIYENKNFSRKSTFLIPALNLDIKYSKKIPNKVLDVTVIGDVPAIIQAPVSVIRIINKICAHRSFQNGTPDEILDLGKGFNIEISKTGKKLDTNYNAIGISPSMKFPESWREKTPNVVEIVRKKLLPSEDLRKIIRNYLYGEPMPKARDAKASKNGKSASQAASKKPAAKGKSLLSKKMKEEEE